jgi:hypothetical protein
VPKAFQPIQEICLENEKTKERLLTRMDKAKAPDPDLDEWEEVVLLISRYPLASNKKWIVENEKDALKWDFSGYRTIYLSEDLKVVPF